VLLKIFAIPQIIRQYSAQVRVFIKYLPDSGITTKPLPMAARLRGNSMHENGSKNALLMHIRNSA